MAPSRFSRRPLEDDDDDLTPLERAILQAATGEPNWPMGPPNTSSPGQGATAPTPQPGDPPDPETAGPEEITAYLERVGPERGTQWLRNNADEIPESRIYVIDEWVANAGEDWQPALRYTEAAADTEDRRVARNQRLEQGTDYVTQFILENPGLNIRDAGARAQVSADLSEMGLSQQEINEAITAGVGEAARQSPSADADGDGEVSDEEADDAAEQAQEELGDLVAPDWIYQLAWEKTGGTLTEAQMNRIVDNWNFLHGTDFKDFSEVVPHLQEFNADSAYLVQSALMDEDPVEDAILVPRPDGKKVPISGWLVQHMVDEFEFDLASIHRMARLGRLDLVPTDDMNDQVMVLASLLRGKRFQDELSIRETEMLDEERQGVRRPAIDTSRLIADIARQGPGQAFRDREDQEAGRPRRPSGPGVATRERERTEQKMTQGWERNTGYIRYVEHEFREGMEKYNNDPSFAYLHTMNAALAARVQRTGGDPTKLSQEDAMRVHDYMQRAGGASAEARTIFDLNPGSPLAYFKSYFEMLNGGGRGGGGGGGRVRRVIDPVSAREQIIQTFKGLLRMDPSEELIKQWTNDLQKQLDAAEEGMNFDISSRILAWVKGQPEYADLYGNMPAGMTEDQYQAQFLAAQQDMLGGEAGPAEAITEGMRTGDYQTTVGMIAGSEQAWGNSRFLEKLARAAQTVSRNT